jgi:hypothetical protein
MPSGACSTVLNRRPSLHPNLVAAHWPACASRGPAKARARAAPTRCDRLAAGGLLHTRWSHQPRGAPELFTQT